MELREAIFDLKAAALRNAAAQFGFAMREEDAAIALRAEPDLGKAFNTLLMREGAAVRFSYAVRQAYRKMSSWYQGT